STVTDMINFYQGHFFGNDILFPDYIKREMQRIQFKAKLGDRGFGFGLMAIPTDILAGHGGGYPGFITRSGLIQEKKVIIVVLTSAVNGPASALLIGINAIFERIEKDKEKLLTAEDKTIPDMKDILGFYKSDWGSSLFSQIDAKLVLVSPSLENPAESLEIYKHQKGLTFKAPKELSFSAPGQNIEFIDGPDDKKVFIDSHKGENKRFVFSY
ncbi:MAG: hypothetical protein ACTSSH_04230, partial [Candidatus Heimdallarchaeota archaeon]